MHKDLRSRITWIWLLFTNDSDTMFHAQLSQFSVITPLALKVPPGGGPSQHVDDKNHKRTNPFSLEDVTAYSTCNMHALFSQPTAPDFIRWPILMALNNVCINYYVLRLQNASYITLERDGFVHKFIISQLLRERLVPGRVHFVS